MGRVSRMVSKLAVLAAILSVIGCGGSVVTPLTTVQGTSSPAPSAAIGPTVGSSAPSSSASTTPAPTATPAQPAHWVAAGSMSKQRVQFQLLLLHDGRALAIGAGYNACQGECSGFPPESTSVRYADLFDPATNSWKTASGLNLNRSDYAAVLLPDGRVVVAGGYADAPYECFSSTKLLDPTAGTWTQAAGLMKLARCDPAYALLPDGRVLLAGGTDIHNKVLASAEVFDPTSQKWSAVASMPAVRAGGEAVTLKSGKVLVVGGFGTSGATLKSAVLYDPASGKWSSAGTLSAPPNGPIVLLPDGGTLVIGEGSYDNIAGKWTSQASERFDPSTLTWTKVGAMVKSRRSPFVASLADGRVLVAGGAVAQSFNSNGLVTTLTSSAEIFDPATNSWSSTVAMPSVREAGDAVLLQDGSVLLAGGDLGAHGPIPTPGYPAVTLLATAIRYVP